MNLKKAKFIRKMIKRMGADWRDAKYIDSQHPKEKSHVVEYPLKEVKWTRTGAKNLTRYVPIKVSTLQLSGCGKKIYRHYKTIGGRI